MEEVEKAHDIIRNLMNTRFSSLRKMFQMVDEDRSGKVTRVEMLRLLMSFNLSGIREKVIDKICEIIDKDGDGVEYDEFCRLMMANDVLPLTL